MAASGASSMSPYQYVVLRCVPRVDREEFVNVGVVLYCQEADFLEARPVYAVWELTMKCDQPCQHCGSRAGAARVKELETEEVFEVSDTSIHEVPAEVVAQKANANANAIEARANAAHPGVLLLRTIGFFVAHIFGDGVRSVRLRARALGSRLRSRARSELISRRCR